MNESTIDIIDYIDFDLNFILNLINTENQEKNHFLYIIASNREILDNLTLKSFLRKLSNENNGYLKNNLKDLLIKSKQIIDFENNLLPSIIEQLPEKEEPIFIDFGGSNFISTLMDFKCKIINDLSIKTNSLKTQKQRDYFIKNNSYKTFQTNDFAKKCGLIIETINDFLSIQNLELYLNEEISTIKNPLPETFKGDNDRTFNVFKDFNIVKIEPLNRNVNNKTPEVTKSKLFPYFFKDNIAFLIFTKFIENDIADPYTDYSFIFQNLKKDNLITDIKHKTFYEWLFLEKHIKEKDYNKFQIAKNLKSLIKSHSDKRLNKYISLKETLIKSTSE